MEIPPKVRKAAKWYIEHFGERIKYMATENGKAIYYFAFPEDSDIGFPIVYLFDGNIVETIDNMDACKIISRHIAQ